MDKHTLWETVLAELQLSLSPADFKTWFADTEICKVEKETVTVGCTNGFAKDRLERHHKQQIQELLESRLKQSTEVLFVVTTKSRTLKKPLGPLFSPKESITKRPTQNKKTGLSPQFTFDNFLVGSNNRLAHAVAVAVAEDPGKNYNPFFLYSSVGLGKTHLIQAIGNAVLEEDPDRRVVYCTGETFTNELISSIQLRTQRAFRKKFRATDVLLIDDVQFIAGRETTQEEFFNTFNALYLSNKQVVLASDRPPKDISKLEERLSSRFAGGMLADMQAPDFDMRVAILREKAKHQNKVIPIDVLEVIADNITTNIRELEGALRQVVTFAETENLALTVTTAEQILSTSRDLKVKQPTSPKEILSKVCTYFARTQKELVGPRRLKEFVLPRQIAMYLIRDLTESSLVEIGDLLGGRDHTTILHGIDKIEKKINKDTRLEKQIRGLKEQL